MALSVLLMFFPTSCGSGQKIRFGSAWIGGNYYITAQTIAGFLKEENEDLEIDVKKTAGSEANLRLLSDQRKQQKKSFPSSLHIFVNPFHFPRQLSLDWSV